LKLGSQDRQDRFVGLKILLFLFETNEMKQSEKIVVEINKPLLKTLTFYF